MLLLPLLSLEHSTRVTGVTHRISRVIGVTMRVMRVISTCNSYNTCRISSVTPVTLTVTPIRTPTLSVCGNTSIIAHHVTLGYSRTPVTLENFIDNSHNSRNPHVNNPYNSRNPDNPCKFSKNRYFCEQ